jgi:hypothetical protein
VPVQGRQLQGTQIVQNAPVAPQRSSVLGRPEANIGRAVQPPAAVQNRAVVAKTPPPPAPIPFAKRQQELARDPGRPLDTQTVQKIRAQEPPPARPQIKAVPPSSGAARPTAAPAAPPTPSGRPVAPGRDAQPAPQPSNQTPSQRVEQPRNQTPPLRTEQPVPQPRVPAPPARVERPRNETPPPRTEQPAPAPRVQAPPSVERPAVPPRRDVEPSRPVPSPARRQAEPARPAAPPPHQGQQDKRPPDKKDNKKDNKKEEDRRNN